MKKNVHPKYQKVLFVDSSTGHKFVCGTSLQPKATEVFEGVEYPVYHLSISSSSHPLFNNNQQMIDTEGRVDKFKKRYTQAQAKSAQQAAAVAAPSEPVAAKKPAKRKK